MLIVFDVGNTENVIGLFDSGKLLDHWRVASHPERTADELGLLVRSMVRESGFDPARITAATIASVVPPVTPAITEMCERHLGARTFIVDATAKLPIRLDVDEPLSVGADRIVNTLAAAQLFRRDTIAVDLGTATTFDCITGDGVFLGGVIAPGVHSGAEMLVRRTARLPRVDLEPPDHVIGRRTDTALRSGIFFGAVDAIDGIVDRIRREWERPDTIVVATGGLAEVVGPHCRTVNRIEPFLTLYGLEIAYRFLSGRAGAPRTTTVRPAPRTARRRR
jgi:type III pantothenate kinase